ncbi:MAG: four helix bundle protein [Balneolaceae bacterium]|nr:four helix bundle protein [Balneolaceae bacterium]
MKYKKWKTEVPSAIREYKLWNVKAYRISLYLSELCFNDTLLLQKQHRYSMANQLYRAVGSISANIAEGYSRGYARDKARFYEYALGSARESKDWYFKSRHILSYKKLNRRMELLTDIIKLLITMINDKRMLS